MAVEDAIAVLHEHWDDVMSRLGTEEAARLRSLIGQLSGPDRDRVVTRIADLLVEELPPEHAVRRALASGYLFQPATVDLAAITVALQGRAIGSESREDPPTSASILREVAEKLLAAPALTDQEVRQRGADPDDPGLIQLDRPDGGRQWPEFQFARRGGPLPVVRAVNDLLGAVEDPIGVADWWLSRNGWLDDQPSLLIGRVPDELLVSAASAARSEV
jgi:hypothetical protein